MSKTSILAATGAVDPVKDIAADVAVATRPAQRTRSSPEFPSTVDKTSDGVDVEVRERADEPDATAMVMRWIPLLVPLVAALMACDTYLIGWAVLAHSSFAHP
jgi:hypothetical protein